MEDYDCCCNTLLLGECFALNNSLIAKCTQMINATEALCHAVDGDNLAQQFHCAVGSCKEHLPDLFTPHQLCIAAGVALIPWLVVWSTDTLFIVDFLLASGNRPSRMISLFPRLYAAACSVFNSVYFILKIQAIICLALAINLLLLASLVLWSKKVVTIAIFLVTLFVLTVYIEYYSWLKASTKENTGIRNIFLFLKDRLFLEEPPEEEPLEKAGIPTLTVTDICLAFEEPPEKAMLIAQCQVALLLIYIWSIATSGELDFSKMQTFAYSLGGAVISAAYTFNKSNNPFLYYDRQYGVVRGINSNSKLLNQVGSLGSGIKYNEKLLNQMANLTSTLYTWHRVEENDGGGESDNNSISYMVFSLRLELSWFINSYLASVVTLLLPIRLAKSDSVLSFVLSVFSGFFIIEWAKVKERKYEVKVERANDEVSRETTEDKEREDAGSSGLGYGSIPSVRFQL